MEFFTAIEYSYQSMTWITWLAFFILGFRAVLSFNKAYENNKTYEEMKNNNDRVALSQFYTGVIVSLLCVVVFFLPYLMNYEG
jgi:hypothetical protein